MSSTSARTLFSVIAKGGDDHVFLLTPEASLVADGGDGDDIVVGNDDRDVLRGGSGDDLVAGRGTTDSIDLGAGADRYEWVSGDGPDRIEGREGDDTAALFGTDSPDEFTIFEQSTGFGITVTATTGPRIDEVEALELRTRGGDDIVDPELIPASLRFDIEGGDGDDSLRGGDGPDRIDGGAGTDHVQGSGGDDVVRGESAVGGTGNDSLTLDAGGLAEDDEGYDVTRVIATDAPDVLSLARQASFVKVSGSAGSKTFSAGATTDAVVLETGAGDDTVAVQPGAGLSAAITVDGGEGADFLRGGDGLEWLAGGAGEDVLDGGFAPDRLDGGADADLIRARDRAPDAIECGSAADAVFADGVDALRDCEQALPGAATNPLALARVADTAELRLDGSGVAGVPVACSQGARGGCLGSVVLVTADPVSIGGERVPVKVGNEPFKIAPGATAEVPVFVADQEDLVRAAASRLVRVQAQVVTDLAEHTTPLSLNILK